MCLFGSSSVRYPSDNNYISTVKRATNIFIMWVGLAENVFKVEGQRSRSYVYKCVRHTFRHCGAETHLFLLKKQQKQIVLKALSMTVWQLLNSRCRTFRYVTNQPPKANSAFHPSGVSKWVPASAGKAKAGMVHSVRGCTRGVQVKLWDPLRTRAIAERLRGVITTRRYTNPHLPYLTTDTLNLHYQR